MQTTTTSHRPATGTDQLGISTRGARARRPRSGSPAGQCRRERPGNPARKSGLPELSAARLEQLEDALINSLLDVHPNSGRALDRLLSDIVAPGGAARPADWSRPSVSAPECSPARLGRIQELLVAAVIDGHPRQRKALDRLLDDLAERESKEQWERAAYDAGCDNDFDGLG